MIRLVHGLVLLATFGSFSAVLADESIVVFVNVNVIPMSSDIVQAQQTVVVANGQIAEIGPVDTVAVAKGAVVVDGTDRFLMPGLAEMHAHVTSTASQSFERVATLFVANGVTTIRGMLGRPDHLNLREKLAIGDVFGPRLFTSGPSLNGRSVSGAPDAASKVSRQFAAGYDFVKIHPGLSESEFVALARTANELGIPFAGHVPVAVGIDTALTLGMATIDHLDGYFSALLSASNDGRQIFGGFFDVMLAGDLDADRIPMIAATIADTDTWIVPTQTLVEQMIDETDASTLRQREEMRYVSRAVVDGWVARKQAQQQQAGFNAETAKLAIKLRRRIILELHRAGAGLLLGSDAPQVFNVPGFSLHRELQSLVDAGLTPYEALTTGTVAVAEFLATNGGCIAEGRDADLILLDANPLIDIRNSSRIHGVMLRGRWLPQSELARRLQQFETSNAQMR